MELYKYYNSIDLNEINRFIKESQEENLTIEFKMVNHPTSNDIGRQDDRKNISKAISGFANSSGGIIIWGIKAKQNHLGQDIASELKPINELTKFLNLLNKLEGQAVTPIIEGVKHKKIELANDIGFIKTFVPLSNNAPHMANFSDKHYYKRSGDSFYQCEHFDIADMFSRKRTAILRLKYKVLPRVIKFPDTVRYNFLISIENISDIAAKFPYLAFNTSDSFFADEFGIDGNRHTGLHKIIDNISYQHTYSGGTDRIIYPKTSIDINYFFRIVPIQWSMPSLKIDYLLTAENANTIKSEILIESEEFINTTE